MRETGQGVVSTQLGIVDVGIANLGSISRILQEIVDRVHIVTEPKHLSGLDRVILPGVGAFPEAMKRLRESHLDKALSEFVAEDAKPILGICLGMHLLAGVGEEFEETAGLGLVEGRARRLAQSNKHRIPHAGWNSIEMLKKSPLFENIPDGCDFYFVHSYVLDPTDQNARAANTTHSEAFCSVVHSQNVMGVQFHPEKSSIFGRQLLRNFCEQF